MATITEREWLQRIRRPWRLADAASPMGTWYIFDDEERQIMSFKTKALAQHLVDAHNLTLEE